MSFQRRLIRLLDRPGGRSLLAFLATRFARIQTRQDVAVFYDHGWFHRWGSVCLADDVRFSYFADTPGQWERDYGNLVRDVKDFWFHLYTPRRGDVIVDIGAGVGNDTLVFSQAVGAEGRVLAVEAHPGTHRRLVNTCKYNGLANVVACHRAVTDGLPEVYISDRDDHQANVVSPTASSECRMIRVPGTSLDQLCREAGIERIDLLKMNVEGAERFIIQGMDQMIAKTRFIAVACHDFLAEEDEAYRTKAVVIEFLERHGFRVSCRDSDHRAAVRDHVHALSLP